MPKKTIYLDSVGPVELTKKRGLRSIRLRVDPHGAVKVSVPWMVPHKFAMDFVTSKQDWIISQQKSTEPFAPYNGMPIGKSFTLYISELSTTCRSRIGTGSLKVSITDRLDENNAQQMEFMKKSMIRVLRSDAECLLTTRTRQLAARYRVEYKGASIKQLTGRWGSCDSQGRIVLGLFLVQLPWELIDYVIIHELAHISHMNHSPKFWANVERMCPDYKATRKKLSSWQPRIYTPVVS